MKPEEAKVVIDTLDNIIESGMRSAGDLSLVDTLTLCRLGALFLESKDTMAGNLYVELYPKHYSVQNNGRQGVFVREEDLLAAFDRLEARAVCQKSPIEASPLEKLEQRIKMLESQVHAMMTHDLLRPRDRK